MKVRIVDCYSVTVMKKRFLRLLYSEFLLKISNTECRISNDEVCIWVNSNAKYLFMIL